MIQPTPPKLRDRVAMTLQRFPHEFLSLDVLGMPPVISELITRPRGLFLVTGPPASGKSMSLASMIYYITRTAEYPIVELEDHIELVDRTQDIKVSEHELGVEDSSTFAAALPTQDISNPILLGELHDRKSIMAAIDASERGSFVLGTMKARTAQDAIDQILATFPADELDQIRIRLAGVLIGILSQAILSRRPKGKVAAFETLVVTPEIAKLIRDAKTKLIGSSILAGSKFGMLLLRSNNPNELKARIANCQ